MTRTWQRTLINILGMVITTGLLLDVKVAFADKAENTMLVWAGDQAHKAPDFIAVVDFDRNSPKYGKVLRTIPLTGRSAIDNEPHHVGISRDGRTLALGGLLSILRGQDQVFFFDVSDPRQPRFISSDSPPDASITDDFFALGNGGFLVTFMGGPNGAEPGRVVEYDARLKRIASWPTTPPADGFNPHGIAVDEAHNLMVTSDFICPLMTLHDHDTRTIEVNPNEGAGMMDVQLIPRDVRLRAYTAGMTDNKLYLIDTQKGTATAVFDFNVPRFQVGSTMISPQLMRINKTGTRLFITLNYGGAAGKVVMFDIARPDHPKVMDVVDLGPNSGPHYLRLTKDDKQIVVTDYFLVEDLMPGGVVQIDGDRKIHVINVHGNRLELDTKFDLDFKRDISTGPARPHGVVLFPDQDD